MSKSGCLGFEQVVQKIGGKWKLMILRKLLYGGTHRFNSLRRSIPGISQTMLTKQLKELTADGLVSRRMYPEVPPRVEYELTEAGQKLRPMFEEMFRWAQALESA